MFLNYVTVFYIYFFFLQLYYLGFKYILILLKGIIMIIKTYLKMTPNVTQIVNIHIQIHSKIVL